MINLTVPASANLIKKKSDYSDINIYLSQMPNATNNIQKENHLIKADSKKNSTKILYEGKAFMEKLNLVEVFLYVKNKM